MHTTMWIKLPANEQQTYNDHGYNLRKKYDKDLLKIKYFLLNC